VVNCAEATSGGARIATSKARESADRVAAKDIFMFGLV
jgi:hypothetical protein